MADMFNEDEVQSISKSLYPGSDVTLIQWRLDPASEETAGFMGCHHRLVLHIHSNDTVFRRTLFVKSVPRNNPQQWEYVVASGAFHKELEVYTKLFRDVDLNLDVADRLWHPRLVYSRDDILVLEDLTQDGFRMVTDDRPLDLDHILLALRTLAYMHGQCLVLEHKWSISGPSYQKTEIKDQYPDIAEETIYNRNKPDSAFSKWMDRGPDKLAVVADLLEGYSDTQRKIIRTRLPQELMRVYPLTEYSTRFKNCFNQGDGWVNNLMFRYEDGKPVEMRLVDYQLCRYLPPAHDVMEVLCLTATRQLRNKHEVLFRDFYYKELSSEMSRLGVDVTQIIPYSQHCDSWKHYKKLGLLRAGIILNVVLTPAHIKQEAETDFDRFILEGRADYIKRSFEDPSYRSRVSDVYHEIIQSYILN